MLEKYLTSIFIFMAGYNKLENSEAQIIFQVCAAVILGQLK